MSEQSIPGDERTMQSIPSDDRPEVLREAMSEMVRGMRSIVQAGIEQGQEDTVLLDLPPETFERGSELYDAQGPERPS